MRRRASRATVFVAAAVVAAALAWTPYAGAAPLPSVADVQAHFVRAIGGTAAIMRPRSMTVRGTNVSVRPDGSKIAYTYVIYAGDFKRLEVDTVPGGGEYASGYDGRIAWAMSPGAKPQVYSGSVVRSIRRDADLYYWAHIGEYFSSMSVVGIEPFGGRQCYHVRATTKWGNDNNQYFDVATGLLVGYRFHQWQGNAPEKAETQQVFRDYRSFGGLSMPTHETDSRDGKVTGTGSIESVTFNDVNPAVFALPEAVRQAAHG